MTATPDASLTARSAAKSRPSPSGVTSQIAPPPASRKRRHSAAASSTSRQALSARPEWTEMLWIRCSWGSTTPREPASTPPVTVRTSLFE